MQTFGIEREEYNLRQHFLYKGYDLPPTTIDLVDLLKNQGPDKDYYHFTDPRTNELGIKYDFALQKLGPFWRIHSITLSKEYSPDNNAALPRTFTHEYMGNAIFKLKENLTNEFQYRFKNAILLDELMANEKLRKQLTNRGFEYNQIIADALEIPSITPSPNRTAFMYEKVPLEDNSGINAKHLWISFNLTKQNDCDHTIDFIESRITADYKNGELLDAFVKYHENANEFPSREQIIRETIARERMRTRNVHNAYEVLSRIPKNDNKTDPQIKIKPH